RDTIRLVYVDAVAASVLGGVTGNVRRAHDVGDILSARGDRHDADARAHRQRARAPDEAEVTNRLAYALGDAGRLLERTTLEKNAELIATEARDDVRSAHARLQHSRDIAQQAVPRRVAAGVVDELELVEVDIQHRVG